MSECELRNSDFENYSLLLSDRTEGLKIRTIKVVIEQNENHYVTTTNRFETSAIIHHCRVGLRAEIRTSFPRSDSSGEIILVRFDRLRAGRQSAGGRQDLAETLSREGR